MKMRSSQSFCMDLNKFALGLVLGEEIIDLLEKDGLYDTLKLKNGVVITATIRDGKAHLRIEVPNVTEEPEKPA